MSSPSLGRRSSSSTGTSSSGSTSTNGSPVYSISCALGSPAPSASSSAPDSPSLPLLIPKHLLPPLPHSHSSAPSLAPSQNPSAPLPPFSTESCAVLHAKAASLANLLSHTLVPSTPISVPADEEESASTGLDASDGSSGMDPDASALPQGLDVLLGEIVMMAARVKDENEQLVKQVRVGHDTQEELKHDLRTLQVKLLTTNSKIDHSLKATSSAEEALAAKVLETEALKKELRMAHREREDVTKRLEIERQSMEKLKQEWADKESKYSHAIKSQKRVNEDLRNETRLMDQQLQEALLVEGSAEPDSFKSKSRGGKEEKLAIALQQLAELQSTTEDVTERLRILEEDRAELLNELEELRTQHASLMEENESYQLLLQQQTLSGEFMDSVVMKGEKRNTLAQASSEAMKKGQSLFDELEGNSGEAARAAANALVEENLRLQNEITALTAYINKVISDTRLRDALSQLPEASPVSNKWPFDSRPTFNPLAVPYRSPPRGGVPTTGRAKSASATPTVPPASVTLSSDAGPPSAGSGLGPRSLSMTQRTGSGGSKNTSFSVARRPGPIKTGSGSSGDDGYSSVPASPSMKREGLFLSTNAALQPTTAASTSGTWSGYLKRGLDSIVGALSPVILEEGVRRELPDVSGSADAPRKGSTSL